MARNSHVVQALGVEDQLGCLACCSGNLLPRIKDPHDSAFISFGRIMAPAAQVQVRCLHLTEACLCS